MLTSSQLCNAKSNARCDAFHYYCTSVSHNESLRQRNRKKIRPRIRQERAMRNTEPQQRIAEKSQSKYFDNMKVRWGQKRNKYQRQYA